MSITKKIPKQMNEAYPQLFRKIRLDFLYNGQYNLYVLIEEEKI
jgi:hypothetical protein